MSQSGYDLEEVRLWKAAVTSALISQELAEKEDIKTVIFFLRQQYLKTSAK